jgi:hypothetical protein
MTLPPWHHVELLRVAVVLHVLGGWSKRGARGYHALYIVVWCDLPTQTLSRRLAKLSASMIGEYDQQCLVRVNWQDDDSDTGH